MMDYSYRGKATEEFEDALKELTGAHYILATNSGTSALHLAYICSGIKPGDEVLTPALTFVGTVNPLAYMGAIPHFIDCDERLAVDPDKLDKYLKSIAYNHDGITYNKLTNRPITALVIVHVLGLPADIYNISKVAMKWNLKVIEDAAQAIGSKVYKPDNYKWPQQCGTICDFGILSFNGNKLLTTGGGGALITWNQQYYEQAKHLSMTAKDQNRKQNYHDQLGYNYRMPAWNAILGLKEIKKLNKRIEKCYNTYREMQKKYTVISPRIHTEPNYWKSGIIDPLHNNPYQPIWGLVSDFPMYEYCPKMDLVNSRYFRNNLYMV